MQRRVVGRVDRLAIAALVGLMPLAGCAGHASTMRDVRHALRDGDLTAARARLADAGRGTDDLLFALEDGLLLYYSGDHELSNFRFEFAEGRVDDLFTQSVTRAALSLVTSDLVLRFEPSGIENFLICYYRGLNYLHLAEPLEALVEWRSLANKLRFSREHDDAPYRDPPFFSHLTGLGLETDDPNDAYIAFRQAELAYRKADRRPPPSLIHDLTRLAARLGFADHLDEYARRYATGELGANGNPGPYRDSGLGEVVVLIEEGLVAPIEESRAYIPILKERASRLHRRRKNEGFRLRLAQDLAREYATGRYAQVKSRRVDDDGEIAYVLPLAFPVFGLGEPAFNRLQVRLGNQSVPGEIGLHVSDLQGQSFEDRLLGIYVKTIARALLKYAAAEKLEDEAEKEGGETAGDVAGILANIINVATERADTRAWLGLPHRIWIARLELPGGRHDVSLLLDGAEEITLQPVDVIPGERTFVTARIF